MNTLDTATIDAAAAAIARQESMARALIAVVLAVLYGVIWVYGGMTWGSLFVAVVLGTLVVMVLSGPLAIVVFTVTMLIDWMTRRSRL